LEASTPYDYGLTRRDDVPVYRRLPTAGEIRAEAAWQAKLAEEREAAEREAAEQAAALERAAEVDAQSTGDGGPSEHEPLSSPTAPAVALEPPTAEATAVMAKVALPAAVDQVSADREIVAAAAPAVAVPNDRTPDQTRDQNDNQPVAEAPEAEEEEEEEEEEDESMTGPIVARLKKGFFVTIERIVSHLGRDWVRTTELYYVDADAILPRTPPEVRGRELGSELALPLLMPYRTVKLRQLGRRGLRQSRAVPRFTALPLLGEVRVGGRQLYSVGGREFAPRRRVRQLILVDPPAGVGPNERWIDVDLGNQTLVAYEGSRAVYATLVSTGKKNHETPEGAYRITSKFVSATMADAAATDEPYLIEDVPWTMYFNLSIALHGAFWHSSFGRVRSHGCVNLAPADARWLFWWVHPELPEGWHGVTASDDNPGTRVHVHQ
jgi:hypothetical protein